MSKVRTAVILAAGMGSRLQDINKGYVTKRIYKGKWEKLDRKIY